MQDLILIGIPGGPEWIIIVLVILLLFGAKKIPELARGIGQGINEFRKASDDIQQEIKKGEEEGVGKKSSEKSEKSEKKEDPPKSEAEETQSTSENKSTN